MEDNNSFLEPEIESSLSEKVDIPAEELSDLEYKEIVGEDEAYMEKLTVQALFYGFEKM